MGHQNREVELKFVVKGLTMNKAAQKLYDHLDYRWNDEASSTDHYWDVPGSLKSNADFMRIRQYDQDDCEMTLKKADKGSNFDRIEIDVFTDVKQAKALLNQLLGPSSGFIKKKYIVFDLDEPGSTVSLYKVKNDPRVFLEIEANTANKVNVILDKVKEVLTLEHEPRSLYQIFLNKGNL